MISKIALMLMAVPVGCALYAYLLYPLALRALSTFTAAPNRWADPGEWPQISIVVPCFNEERAIRGAIECLLALDYPAERRQILIVSDASTDRTDEIARSYAERGVELLRLPERKGKTAAENAALARLSGEIIVHTDATIRIPAGSVRRLVAPFCDPTVGVASGRDVSVGDAKVEVHAGESGYVGYEMWIRSLETRLGTIIGASGCFFADRRSLYDASFPEELSRDFASCLIAREHGFRAVSVDAAPALVPRAPSPRGEFHRKIRTMARGLATLNFKRHLLNPFASGGFAVMLFSHKLCRWLVQLTLPMLGLGALLLALGSPRMIPALLLLAASSLAAACAAILTYRWPTTRSLPRLLSTPGFLVLSNVAGFVAWSRFLRGRQQPVWEPTRRPAAIG